MANWHIQDAASVVQEQNSDAKKGLSTAEVQKRQSEFGLNEFAKKKKEKLIFQILRQFKDVAVIVLMIAVVLSAVMAVLEWNHVNPETGKIIGARGLIEPIVIFTIIAMNAALAVIQERGAEKALEALAVLNSPHCFVIRDGSKQQIVTNEVVPGDLIVLKSGDLVPADARIIESESFSVDESSLTGESEPSGKKPDTLTDEEAPLGDRKNMVYSGCLVTAGHATAVVVTTGMNTQIGKIARYLQTTKKMNTPLQTRLDKLGKTISAIAIASAVVLFLIGWVQGQPLMDMAMLAIALAVAAVPETLMLIVTLTLTNGVKKMVTKNALIRKLQAVETLGSTSVICSDKTGTLTQNKMSVKRLWLLGGTPASDAETGDEHLALLKKLLIASNVTVGVEEGETEQKIIGDPTETAIMRICIEKGINKAALDSEFARVAEIPFSSARKMMTVAVKQKDGKILVLTKGAFDRIPFKRPDLEFVRTVEEAHNAFAADALRVITLASKVIDKLPAKPEELEKDLNFEGFIGIIDPPRPEAAAAIALAKSAGIRTIMITGDHAATAGAIAKELGIIAGREGIITGQELAKLSDTDLANSIEYFSVYARVTPEDKIRIVQAWQMRGAVVSMTGDGVNDAPALKAADVGVAMGINGTEVSKSASDMILTDDKFSTIVDAVTEGRNVFSNIRKLIYFLLVCNISEVLIMIFGQISGWGLIVTPIMLLLVNVIGDGIPGMALAKEQSDTRIMNRKPIDRNESFFSGGLMEVIIRQTIVCSIVVLVGFYIGKFIDIGTWTKVSDEVAQSQEKLGQTLAFIILGWTSILHIFTARSRRSIFRRSMKDNLMMPIGALGTLLLMALLAAIPGLNTILGMVNMDLQHWLIAIGLSLIPTLVAEYGKFWDNYKFNSAEKNRVKQQKIE